MPDPHVFPLTSHLADLRDIIEAPMIPDSVARVGEEGARPDRCQTCEALLVERAERAERERDTLQRLVEVLVSPEHMEARKRAGRGLPPRDEDKS